ncbi:MAG TPA: hypothetical protein VF066_06360 [Thermoleophilaceae bacterium]
MTLEALTNQTDEQLVREILDAAGPRGASHEDFVEAGLARDYIATLRHLVDTEGLEIRTDFTTGQARWALVTDAARRLRAA